MKIAPSYIAVNTSLLILPPYPYISISLYLSLSLSILLPPEYPTYPLLLVNTRFLRLPLTLLYLLLTPLTPLNMLTFLTSLTPLSVLSVLSVLCSPLLSPASPSFLLYYPLSSLPPYTFRAIQPI